MVSGSALIGPSIGELGALASAIYFAWFRAIPTPLGFDYANHRLPAGMDMDMLDCDFLLTFAAMAI